LWKQRELVLGALSFDLTRAIFLWEKLIVCEALCMLKQLLA
jgi:hypothetical protein